MIRLNTCCVILALIFWTTCLNAEEYEYHDAAVLKLGHSFDPADLFNSKQNALELKEQDITFEPRDSSKLTMSFVEDTASMYRALGKDLSVQGSYAFTAKASVRVSSLEKYRIDSRSVAIVLGYERVLGRNVVRLNYSTAAAAFVENGEVKAPLQARFATRFGTEYVSQEVVGARLYFVYEFRNVNESMRSELRAAASIAVRSGATKVNASASLERVLAQHRNRIEMRVDLFAVGVDAAKLVSPDGQPSILVAASEGKVTDILDQIEKAIRGDNVKGAALSYTTGTFPGLDTREIRLQIRRKDREFGRLYAKLLDAEAVSDMCTAMKRTHDLTPPDYRFLSAERERELNEALRASELRIAAIHTAITGLLSSTHSSGDPLPELLVPWQALAEMQDRSKWHVYQWLLNSDERGLVSEAEAVTLRWIRWKFGGVSDAVIASSLQMPGAILNLDYVKTDSDNNKALPKITDLAPLRRLPNVCALSLQGHGIKALPEPLYWNKLVSLDLSGNVFGSANQLVFGNEAATRLLRTINTIETLTSLSLAGCGLCDEDFQHLAPAVKQLVRLDLGSWGRNETLSNHQCTSLTVGAGDKAKGYIWFRLPLSTNDLVALPVDLEAPLLEWVSFADNRNLSGVNCVTQFPKLRVLSLKNTAVTSQMVLGLCKHNVITTLDLTQCRNIRQLSTLERLISEIKSLRKLTITNCGSPLANLDGLTAFDYDVGVDGTHYYTQFAQGEQSNGTDDGGHPFENGQGVYTQKAEREKRLKEWVVKVNKDRPVSIAVVAKITGFGGKLTGDEKTPETDRKVGYLLYHEG